MTNALTTVANEVANEVLTDTISSRCACPCCGTDLNKAVYSDGDSLACTGCGEELWFELRGGDVIAHQANQKPQGSSLSELLQARQLR